MRKIKSQKRAKLTGVLGEISVAAILMALAIIAVSIVSLIKEPSATEVFNTSHSWYYKPRTDGQMPVCADDAPFIKDYENVIYNAGKGIVLTFDTGYENGNTAAILDVLKEKKVKAAFFVTGHYVKTNPEIVRRMEAEGHLVCNHTVNHIDLSAASKKKMLEEVEGLEEMYREVTGKDMPKCIRPPEGKYSEDFLRYAKDEGYKVVFWSFAYKDWLNDDQPGEQEALETILSRTHDGMIALLHSNSETNAKILERLIDAWREKYTVRDADEVLM